MFARGVGTVLALLAVPLALRAQLQLDRTPNMGGTWVVDPGVLQFNFEHRFYVSPAAQQHSVVNFPTFTFALGLPARINLGTRYSTRSETPGHGNEIELFGRWRMLGGPGAPVAVSITPAWNAIARSADGELGVDWNYGHVTLSGAIRGMTKPFGEKPAKAALAGGAVIRLNSYVAVAGDVASFLSPDTLKAAWSGGLLFIIPGSPHTFSLHASNVSVNTIEGSSRRGGFFGLAKVVYGFEFTIPIHFKRFAPWFHRGGGVKAAATGERGAAAATVRIAQIKFLVDSVTITAGQVVRWVNEDPLDHTVTFDTPGAPPGSQLISMGGSYAVRFDRPGAYAYHCTPHAFMKGVVVVK
ncbi:MAG TPA: plastocyanin/azurin family copper-binding protein [Gemmatimonadales bacterium]